MVYNPEIPQANDDMSLSQGDLLTNFTDINTIYGTSGDHVAFDAAADRGKHNKVTYVSQGTDPTTDAPATLENELAMFSLEESGDTELYMRKESNGTVSQMTKDSELYIGVHPVFAINIKDLTPSANIGAGTGNFTVSSSFNYDSATSFRITASECIYEFHFTNPVLDSAGAATNNYMFTASGFDSVSRAVTGQPPNTANYATVVDSSFIRIAFINNSNANVTALTGGVVVCWRIQ